jgi:peroxiredoxin family protein
MMHSDYCRIGGKTVNQWLEEPEGMASFLEEMEKGQVDHARQGGQRAASGA